MRQLALWGLSDALSHFVTSDSGTPLFLQQHLNVSVLLLA